jgi:hypothetical protein
MVSAITGRPFRRVDLRVNLRVNLRFSTGAQGGEQSYPRAVKHTLRQQGLGVLNVRKVVNIWLTKNDNSHDFKGLNARDSESQLMWGQVFQTCWKRFCQALLTPDRSGEDDENRVLSGRDLQRKPGRWHSPGRTES